MRNHMDEPLRDRWNAYSQSRMFENLHKVRLVNLSILGVLQHIHVRSHVLWILCGLWVTPFPSFIVLGFLIFKKKKRVFSKLIRYEILKMAESTSCFDILNNTSDLLSTSNVNGLQFVSSLSFHSQISSRY